MKTRGYWRKEARKTGDPIVWRTYRELRQEVKREIKNAEKEFFADEVLKHPNNTNNIWKTIRQFIPTSTKRTELSTLITLSQDSTLFPINLH